MKTVLFIIAIIVLVMFLCGLARALEEMRWLDD